MLGSWESAVGSHFTAPPLYRFLILTRIFYTSITCQMEIKNNCFYTLHCIVYMSINTATDILTRGVGGTICTIFSQCLL